VRHGGLVHLAARLAGRVPASRSTRPASRAAKWAALLLPLLAMLTLTAAALAQSIDVTASLDITNGLARPGAYVPVRLKVTNGTDETLSEVRIRNNSPVAVAAPWRLAPGEKGEQVLPIFYAGGDLTFSVEFAVSGSTRSIRAPVAPPNVRIIEENARLIALDPTLPDPDEARLQALREMFGATALHLLRLPPDVAALVRRCGLLDAELTEASGQNPDGVIFSNLVWAPGLGDLVQPAAYQPLGAEAWPARDRGRLFVWLGVFTFGVLVAGLLMPRKRWLAAALTIAGLGAAAAILIWLMGDLTRAQVLEARAFYRDRLEGNCATLEHFVYLQSRGNTTSWYRSPRPGAAPLPLPLLAGSEDLFRPQFTLLLGSTERVEAREPGVLMHTIETVDKPFQAAVSSITHQGLKSLADRPDVIAAILIEGDRATDAAGKTQSLDAWAVDWQASEDPDVAFAGRSLAWWRKDRQEGDGPWLLAWWHDPLPAAEASENHERLPALVVYSPAPKQP